MMVKVSFPNGSYITVSKSLVDAYFGWSSDITVEELGREQMTKKDQLNNAKFSSLVGAIDAKWGYSYEPVNTEEQPWDDLIANYMDQLVESEGDHYAA